MASLNSKSFLVYCECGNRKNRNAYACRRCLHLDGSTITEYEAIACLVEFGEGATLRDLVDWLNSTPDAVFQLMKRLQRKGRVWSALVEHDNAEVHRVYLLRSVRSSPTGYSSPTGCL